MKEHKIRIIDKNDMTFPRICTHCSKSSPVVVQFGTEGDGPFFDEASFADICPTCLKEAIAALPHESNAEKDLKIEAAFKKLATELSIKTTYITTEEYLKNAGAARIEAERVGRVIVRDKGSDQNRLIISSNRASGLLLEDDKEEGETRHTCCDCKPCLASGLVIHRRSNGEPAFVNTLMNVRRRMAEAEAILYNPAYDAFKRDPAVGILTTEEMAKVKTCQGCGRSMNEHREIILGRKSCVRCNRCKLIVEHVDTDMYCDKCHVDLTNISMGEAPTYFDESGVWTGTKGIIKMSKEIKSPTFDALVEKVGDLDSTLLASALPYEKKKHPHLIDGEFQSDKYPTTPRGKVPLSCNDKTAQDLLWEYAQRRRSVDKEFSQDLEIALCTAGYEPWKMQFNYQHKMCQCGHASYEVANHCCVCGADLSEVSLTKGEANEVNRRNQISIEASTSAPGGSFARSLRKPLRHCPHTPKHITYEGCLGTRGVNLTPEECEHLLEYDATVITTSPRTSDALQECASCGTTWSHDSVWCPKCAEHTKYAKQRANDAQSHARHHFERYAQTVWNSINARDFTVSDLADALEECAALDAIDNAKRKGPRTNEPLVTPMSYSLLNNPADLAEAFEAAQNSEQTNDANTIGERALFALRKIACNTGPRPDYEVDPLVADIRNAFASSNESISAMTNEPTPFDFQVKAKELSVICPEDRAMAIFVALCHAHAHGSERAKTNDERLGILRKKLGTARGALVSTEMIALEMVELLQDIQKVLEQTADDGPEWSDTPLFELKEAAERSQKMKKVIESKVLQQGMTESASKDDVVLLKTLGWFPWTPFKKD